MENVIAKLERVTLATEMALVTVVGVAMAMVSAAHRVIWMGVGTGVPMALGTYLELVTRRALVMVVPIATALATVRDGAKAIEWGTVMSAGTVDEDRKVGY